MRSVDGSDCPSCLACISARVENSSGASSSRLDRSSCSPSGQSATVEDLVGNINGAKEKLKKRKKCTISMVLFTMIFFEVGKFGVVENKPTVLVGEDQVFFFFKKGASVQDKMNAFFVFLSCADSLGAWRNFHVSNAIKLIHFLTNQTTSNWN